jgi:hypothetical protein
VATIDEELPFANIISLRNMLRESGVVTRDEVSLKAINNHGA